MSEITSPTHGSKPSEKDQETVDNLVEYYRFERSTKIDTEIVVASTKFCLELIVEHYEKSIKDHILADIARKRLAELEYETFSNFCFVRR